MIENLFSANGHIVGIVLKELVRRAIVIARRQMVNFEVNEKLGYSGKMDDVFTSADRQAQESYVKLLCECFPEIGIIGEENALVTSGIGEADAYLTVDPLDGTKAYVRRQSHGVGSMVALVINGVIASAYVGDVNTREIFGYRPESSSVWRITDLEVYEKLDPNPPGVEISELYVLLRERESKHCKISCRTIDTFKSVQIDGGSIGTWTARLWKKEVGALLLYPSWETPWDSSPVIGISQKLGYRFLKPAGCGCCWEEYSPLISRDKYRRNHDTFIIHENQLYYLAKHVSIIRD